MAEHNDLGKSGENAAVAYLEQKGYLIRDRNWRRGHSLHCSSIYS